MKITEHNLLTGEITERDQTVSEIAQVAADQAEAKAQAEAQAARTIAREALLDRLGITAGEAALLLG